MILLQHRDPGKTFHRFALTVMFALNRGGVSVFPTDQVNMAES
jgi:hypothetical protein